MNEMTVEEQFDFLTKGAAQVIETHDLLAKLRKSNETGKPLCIKVGFDPSAPDIHLGHSVVMRKMKHFQDLGHRVVFLIGDFTGMIGDPSGKKKTRPQLSRKEVEENAKTYKEQFSKILDPDKTVLDFNSRWLGNLGSEGLLNLASRYTTARILERDDFKNRWENQKPIFLHELFYPLMQAYDSVFLECDVEMGGTDQTFNLLVGREIMREYNQEPQVVLTLPLLVGLDGVEKMSKSLGNYIGINEPPKEIYGKIMSINDEIMWDYYTLCTDLTPTEIERKKSNVSSGELHPKKAKGELARIIISYYYSKMDAEAAEEEFERVFAQKKLPDEIEEREIHSSPDKIWLPRLLNQLGFLSSNQEGKRLIQGGGVSIDGEKITNPNFELDISSPNELIIKIGKRRFLKLKIK